MARVLILSLVFSPDTVSTANLITDIAQGLQQRGHTITVLTSAPHYNPSPQVLSNPTYRPRFYQLFTDVVEKGVRVIRVYMPLKGQRLWLRVFDYCWFQAITTLATLWKVRRQDIVFVESPPITLGVSGYVLSKILRAQQIYDLRELWPDVPVRLGLIKNKCLVRLVYAVEKFVYRKSAAICAITRSFIDNLVRRGVPKEKLFFTPTFVDVDWLTPRSKQNDFAREHGLENKFVVFYAGNIGLTQGMEILIDVARELQNDAEIRIVVVGDGAGRPRFVEAVQKSGLANILLLGFQPYHRVPDMYATADVCVSPMQAGFSYDTIPSKIYTVMAAGRPVVSACEFDTESALLLRESNGGIVVRPESAREMIDAVLTLKSRPEERHKLGQNARQWIVAHYSKEAVVNAYDQVIQKVAAAPRG